MAIGYFFDSYAIIELTKGNPRYAQFSDAVVTLTIFNIVEIVYSALQELGEEKAREDGFFLFSPQLPDTVSKSFK